MIKNRTILPGFALLILGLSAPIYAQEINIGFVDTAHLLKEAPQADAARKKLEQEFAPRDAKIVKMQKDLKGLEEKLTKDTAVLSGTERKKMKRDIISKKRDIKRAKEEFNEDLNIRRNEELGKLQKLVFDAIVTLAREKKYDAILGDSVLFASERVDVTKMVLDRLRKEFKPVSIKTTTKSKK